ncbi:hypothetical protein RRG08_048365 [Elysia crispata]|uniref:Uncharacterized protein n=1 Tax=Elysia crispata TaxID=231223 RepID=A0AAE1ED99_9GAST|nr:hypothetical protein RRG08_048365 [Elysia crispata]
MAAQDSEEASSPAAAELSQPPFTRGKRIAHVGECLNIATAYAPGDAINNGPNLSGCLLSKASIGRADRKVVYFHPGKETDFQNEAT